MLFKIDVQFGLLSRALSARANSGIDVGDEWILAPL